MRLINVFEYLLSNSVNYLKFIFLSVPIAKSYDLTYKCNLTCKHCYFYKNNEKTSKDISDDEWITFLRCEKRNGIHEVYLTGGEPLLRMNVVRAANEIFGDDHVNIVTNGTVEIPQEFKNNIFVSIDGDEVIHNKIRGGDYYNRIIKNVKNDKRIIVTTTLSKKNYHTIDAVCSAIKNANVKGISFSLYTSKSNDDEDLLVGKELIQTITLLRKVTREYKGFVLLSNKMIDTYLSKKHIKSCLLRNGMVVSHNPNLSVKKPCIFGEGIDCSTCGCHIPVIAYSLKKLDIETMKMIRHAYRRIPNAVGSSTECRNIAS